MEVGVLADGETDDVLADGETGSGKGAVGTLTAANAGSSARGFNKRRTWLLTRVSIAATSVSVLPPSPGITDVVPSSKVIVW